MTSQPNPIQQTNLPGVAVGDVSNVAGVPSSEGTQDLLVYSGGSFARLAVGNAGQQLVVRSDGTVKWVDAPSVSAKAWGATANGTTDDTAAIQAAVNTGKDVFLPAGTYLLAGTVTLPYGNNGQVIRGAGAGLTGAAPTTINYTGSGYAFVLGGATVGNFTRYQFLEELELVGTSSAIAGVHFTGTRWCGIRRCVIRQFSGAGACGALIDGSNSAQYANYYNRIEHCWFDSCPWGIYLRGDSSGAGANSNVVTGSEFTNCTSNGIIIDGGDTNRIEQCEFSGGTATGVRIIATNTPCTHNTVVSCEFDGCTGGVLISSGTQTQLLGNTGPNYTVTDNNGVGSSCQSTRIDWTLRLPIVVAAYSAAITPDSSEGPWQTITAANATAFTINAPTNPPAVTQTQELVIEIYNNSGGAMGAITWNATYLFPTGAWANPATGKHRFARFQWNGANWICTSLATADY